MVGSTYLLQNDVGNQTCILFGRRSLGPKQSPRVFLGLRHIRIGLDVDMADDGDWFALILGTQPGNKENETQNGKCHGEGLKNYLHEGLLELLGQQALLERWSPAQAATKSPQYSNAAFGLCAIIDIGRNTRSFDRRRSLT
jgi:hypothetical protein